MLRAWIKGSLVMIVSSAFFCSLPLISSAQDIFIEEDVLTLAQCIKIALQVHPDVVGAQKKVEAQESRVGQASSQNYPTLSASTNYARSSPAGGSVHSNYSSDVSLSQLVTDFGQRETQIDIQKENVTVTEFQANDRQRNIAYGVSEAYYGVLAAKRNVAVAEQTVEQFEEHLRQAQGFYEAGTAPRFDVTKAQVDLSTARLDLIKARSSLEIAWKTLNNAMGFMDAPSYDIADDMDFKVYEITKEEALERAMANRPDLKAQEHTAVSAQKSLRLAAKGQSPTLSAYAAYNFEGRDFPLDEGWNYGLSLSVPVFDGHLVEYKTKEAAANLEEVNLATESMKNDIILEVEQGYLSLIESEERVGVSELTVKQAEENLELALGRYEAGVGSPIEVTDATVALNDARRNYIQALYDYRMASMALKSAMGESMP
ncbi:MAG: TolC family protein [Synergistaceae bacterium]|jgi:outer membrane protein|nr:TolC family protein [Synergistaceae bacterium]